MSELEEKLALLKQKHDGDIFNADNVHTLVEGIEYAMSHGGDVSVAVTPVENGYKITVTDSEGNRQEATVQNGGDAYAVYVSTVPEGQEPMGKTEWLASLKGDKGEDAVNPFKGWWKTGDTLPMTGFDGAYLYFKDTAQTPAVTTIYQWNGTTYVDTGTEVDESNVQTFETGQAVNGVAIDGTGLVNPADNALAKAVDAMQLMVMLEGVTAREDKASYSILTGATGKNGYIKKDGSTIVFNETTNQTDYISCKINVVGYRRLRFKGLVKNSSTAYAFGFLDSNGNLIDSTVENYDGDTSQQQDFTLKEYVIDIPTDASYFGCAIKLPNAITESDFYCYLLSGESAGESINKLKTDVDTLNLDVYGGEALEYVPTEFEYTELNTWGIDANNVWAGISGKSQFTQFPNGTKIKLENVGDFGFIYTLLSSVSGYATSGTPAQYAVGWGKRVLAKETSVEIDVPAGYYLYWVKQSSAGTNQAITSILQTVTKEPLADKIPNVIDNLESSSSIDALSAKQGKHLNDLLFGGYDVEKEVDGKVGSTDLEITGWSEIINAAFDANSNNYKWSAGSEAGNRKSRVINLSQYKNAGFTDIVIEASSSSMAAWTFTKEQMDVTQSETLDEYQDNLIDYMNGKGLASIGAGKSTMISLSEVEDANYLYIKIQGSTDTILIASKILFLKGEKIKSIIPDISNIGIGLTHLAPDNMGQLNAVKRMRKLTDIRWTPVFDISRGSSGGGESFFHDVFKAGTTYQGIPYSRSTYKKDNYGYGDLGRNGDSGFKVGITISLETFITAISNRGTVMELESIFSRSSHVASFYSNICAGAACAACGLPYIKTNDFDADINQQSLANLNIQVDGNTYVFTCIGRISNNFNLKLLRLGDIMALNEVHTVLVTDVIIENDVVKYVEVGELTTQGNANYNDVGNELGGHGRRLWWSVDDFVSSFNKYKVLRYNGIADTPYTPSPYAPMVDEQQGYAPYTMAVLPYMGNKFRYVAGATNLNDILKVVVTVKGSGSGADKVYAKKYLSITRKVEGQEPVEFIEDIPIFGENDEYVYVVLNDDKYKVVGEYEAFAFVEREWDSNKGAYRYYCSENQTSSSTGKTSKCNWSVVESLTNLTDY